MSLFKNAKAMSSLKAERENERKIDYTIIPWEGMDEVVAVFEMGAKKYARDNYKLGDGLPLDTYRKSMLRHLLQSVKEQDVDEESGLDHIAHLVANGLMYLWQKEHEKNLQRKPGMIESKCPECGFPFITKMEDVINCPSCGVPLISNKLADYIIYT